MANAADSYDWSKNPDDLFQTDLNPLAQKVGAGADGVRDTLATNRDTYLKPYYEGYRTAMGGTGEGKAPADDATLFGSSAFQNYVKTGQAPSAAPQGQAPQSVAQQWTQQTPGQAAATAQTTDRKNTLYDTLLSRANQSLTVDPNDPNIRQQTDAYAANEERAKRNYLADVAEKDGPNANIRGETRMANERVGQRTGTFASQLVGQELTARRAEIQHALDTEGAMLTEDQRLALQEKLAMFDNALKQQGLGLQEKSLGLQEKGLNNDMTRALLQNQQFQDDLGLRAEDRASYYDLVRRGLL